MNMDKNETDQSFVQLYSSSVLFFNIRFSFYISKISSLLSSIQFQLSEPKNHELVDDDVLERERKMAAEFERRFSRINLYPIQLKLKKLENQIVIFKLKHTCKIGQTFVLRSLVLSIFKNLADSVHTYSKFIRKLNISIYTKLKDLLSYISHAFYTVNHIVDHTVLEIHDLLKLIVTVSDTIEIISSNKANEIREISVKKTKRILKRSKFSAAKPNLVASKINEKKVSSKYAQQKSVRFETGLSEAQAKPLQIHVDEHLRDTGRKISFKERLCVANKRLCERIVDDLIEEMIEDITESVRSIATESFNREFSARN